MIRRLAAALAVAGAVLLTTAAPASALPVVDPGHSLSHDLTSDDSCKTAPVPAMPGAGVPGYFDHTDHHKAGTSVYDQYGYAGMQWHTYDLGCVLKGEDLYAWYDTLLGNMSLGIATGVVAIANSLHAIVAKATFLDVFDPVLARASHALGRSLFTPWIGVSLLLFGVGLTASAVRLNLRSAMWRSAWALIVLTLAVGLLTYPVRAGHVADTVTTATVGQINGDFNGHASKDPDADRASLIVNALLYRQWLRGEFGDPDSAVARKYGRALLDAQTFTWGQKQQLAKHPDQADKVRHGKATAWANITGKIKKEDPAAYESVTGHADSRRGAGALAFLGVFMAVAFLIAADLVVLTALVVWRLGVLVLPVLALFGIHRQMPVTSTITVLVTAQFNACIFTAGAGVQLVCLDTLLGHSTAIPEWLTVTLAAVTSWLLWHMLRPFRSATSMVSKSYSPFTAVSGQVSHAKDKAGDRLWSGMKLLAGYKATERGAEKGTEKGQDKAREDSRPRPEAWSRTQWVAAERVDQQTGGDRGTPAPESAAAATSPAPSSGVDRSRRHTPLPTPPPTSSSATPAVWHADDQAAHLAPRTTRDAPHTGQQPDDGVDLLPADEQLPDGIHAANAVIVDGHVVYNTWAPDVRDRTDEHTGRGTTDA